MPIEIINTRLARKIHEISQPTDLLRSQLASLRLPTSLEAQRDIGAILKDALKWQQRRLYITPC